MEKTIPRLMTYKQSLIFFNIGSYNTLYGFIKDGLPVTVVGKTKRIDRTMAEKWLQSKTISNKS